jgi:hypothetical protein
VHVPVPERLVHDRRSDQGHRQARQLHQPRTPRNASNVPIESSDYNRNDGFSVGPTILTHVPNIDLAQTGAAPITDVERSLDAGAPIVLIKASTGAKQLMFVELDANASTEPNRSLIIRPAINLEEGTRYIVALRNLKDAAGDPLSPEGAFLAYRDNTPTGDPDQGSAPAAHGADLHGPRRGRHRAERALPGVGLHDRQQAEPLRAAAPHP